MEPVRWGFVGAGGIATTALGPAVRAADGAVLYAAAARDVSRAAALKPAGPSYGSYDALVADPDVEAVYISLANDRHRPVAEAALRAGKAVLCEKPLAMSAAEVDAMTATAVETGGLLVEASWYRWHPRTQLAQRLLADGAIGPVRHVAAGFTFDGVPAGNYRLDAAMGGGALYDIGCYAISAVLWAFAGRPPLDVTAQLQYGETGVDVTADLILGFDGGDAEIHVSIGEPARQWLVITGERGEIELRPKPYAAWRDDATEVLISTGADTQRRAVPAVDAYQLMVQDVSALVRGGAGYVVPLTESRATAAVIDAAFASGAAGSAAVPVRPTGSAA